MINASNSFIKRLQKWFSNRIFLCIFTTVLTILSFLIFNYCAVCVCSFANQLIEMIQNKTQLHFVFPSFLTFDPGWMFFYCILAVVSIVLSVRIAYLFYKCWQPLNQGQKGSRQFSELDELKQQYRSVPEKEVFYHGKGGFPISRYNRRIFIDDSPVNNMVVGTTRSGKGELIVFPMIDIYSRAKSISNRASMIVSDPKGELAAASKDLLESRSYNVLVFDLIQFRGLSYNPLKLVLDAYLQGDTSTAQLLANTLSHILFHDPHAKDKTWENWSIALTNALIFAVIIDNCAKASECNSEQERQKYYDKINMYSTARLLIDLGEIDESGKSNMDRFFACRPLDDIARMQYASVEAAQGKTKGNIYANTLSVLTKFTFDNIAKMTAYNNIDLANIGFDTEKPTAVFLTMPDYDTSNHFLVTIFISQLYFVLSKQASLTSGGGCPREVIFILDEFGNISPIPNMANITTVCLGRNIRFTLIIQAYSQVVKNYGSDDAKTIIGNCGNQVYILTIELDTAKQFTQLIGDKTITVFSRSGDPLSLDKHFEEHIESKPLLNPNELMEFLPGENVVVRITKRTDLKGNKVKPNPIYNHDETIMKYRYEYLSDFDTEKSFNDLEIDCCHKNLSLQDILMDLPLLNQENKDVKLDSEESFIKGKPLYKLLNDPTMQLFEQLLTGSNIDDDWPTWTIDRFDQTLQSKVEEGELSEAKYDDIVNQLNEVFMNRR